MRISIGAGRHVCAVCVMAWSLGAGCTVNGTGLVGGDRRQYFQNRSGTGRSVMIDVWGINLSTIQGDAGLTLGRTRRTYFLPGPDSAQPSAATEHLSGSGDDDEAMRLIPTGAFNWRRSRPLAVRGRTEGVSVGTGLGGGAGFTLGIRAFDALCLPPDSNLFLLIKSRATRPADDVFHVKEIKK